MPTVITYRQVFGVDLGGEVQESHGVSYTPCPATSSLKKQLFKTGFFTQNASKVGGVGPLFVDWGHGVLKHEFNRHHAGLAVDIMLKPGTTEVALGHALVLLFNQLGATLNFRGMIYQDVTVDLQGNGTRSASAWTDGGHDDHIHIDWHNTGSHFVMWQDIAGVPLRRISGGDPVTMQPKNGKSIATSIEWSSEAATVFDGDPTLAQGLTDVLNDFAAGKLQPRNLKRELGVTP
jgi:hypothetical protein